MSDSSRCGFKGLCGYRRCGHCKNLAPHWAEAATELKGRVKLGALDATVHTVAAGKFNVSLYEV